MVKLARTDCQPGATRVVCVPRMKPLPTLLRPLTTPRALDQARSTTWHVRFRFDGTDNVARYPTELAAIEAACRLIDDGCRVFGIGPRLRDDTLNKDQIACVHELWAKAKHSPPASLIGRKLCHWPEPSHHPISTTADASFAVQEHPMATP
jgi:hypothetical protein